MDKKESEENAIQIPVIENIHQKVLAAVETEGAFDMGDWHNKNEESKLTCGMTHCRGGHVINIAGKAGYDLEAQTSSEFAAMAIYSKSSAIKVSPVRFYETNEVAMADIKRCAELEKAGQ